MQREGVVVRGAVGAGTKDMEEGDGRGRRRVGRRRRRGGEQHMLR